MGSDPEALERLHQALDPDLDPAQLTDAELAEIGVTREDATAYADFVLHLMRPWGDPASSPEVVAYLDLLAAYYAKREPSSE